MKKNFPTGLLIVGLIGVLSTFWLFDHFTVIEFNNIDATQVPKVLLGLTFVALLIERATEVYVNMEEQPGQVDPAISNLMLAEAELVRTQNAVTQAQANPAIAGGAMPNLNADLEAAYANHQTTLATAAPVKEKEGNARRRRTTILGMVLGVLAAMVGARALGPFVDVNQLAKGVVWGGQSAWFASVDVLITGGLLAGGADGIHQIVNRFLEFAKKKP